MNFAISASSITYKPGLNRKKSHLALLLSSTLLAAGLSSCGSPSESAAANTPIVAAPAAALVAAAPPVAAPPASVPNAKQAALAKAAKDAVLVKAKEKEAEKEQHQAVVDAAAVTAASVVPAAAPAPAPEPTPAVPATRTQAGRVIDEAGQPLVGATIFLKGSAKGTSTDANGNYSFEVPAGENTFLFGYGGYEDEVAKSHDGQPLTVTLLPSAGTEKLRKKRR